MKQILTPTGIPTVAPESVSTTGLKGIVSDHLNMLRGIAAFMVLLTHVRNGLFVDYPEVTKPNPFLAFFYFVSGLGHQAVMIFFVLSGFFITLSVVKAIKRNRLSWKAYLIARFSRLWIVLIPALLLGVLWDGLGMTIFGKGGVYGSNLFLNEYTGISTISDRFNLTNGLGNALFLQRILVPSFGSNDALWSLSYEFWYYMLFPLLLLLFMPRTSLARRLLTAVVFVAIGVFVGRDIALYFLIWLMGAGLVIAPFTRILQNTRWLRWAGLVVSGAGALGCLVLSRTKFADTNIIILDFALGFFTASGVYLLFHFNRNQTVQTGFFRGYSRAAELFASFSYTLYLVHLPLLTFLRAALLPAQHWQPTPVNLLFALLIIVFVMFYAFGISRLTEANTDKVRDFLTRKLQ